MEPKKQTLEKSGAARKALIICSLFSSSAMHLHAQNSGTGSGQITIGEILLYVVIIIVVIAIAWVFASKQSGKSDKEHHSAPMKKHYDHPNDPHFKKLRKKTS